MENKQVSESSSHQSSEEINLEMNPQEKIRKINKEAGIMGQTLRLMLDRFKIFEQKLKEMENE
jgi:hypothetical protein